jgi:hypothetical protein
MAAILKTSKGALCQHTGPHGGRGLQRTGQQYARVNGKFQLPNYIQVQMLPAHPQRMEWVREDHLVEVEERLPTRLETKSENL